MRRSAEAFVDGKAYPVAVYRALREHGVSRDSAILVDDRTPSQECCEGVFAGLLLTADGRFLEFEFDVPAGAGVASVEKLTDVTAETSTDARAPGIGTSDGFLAHELLTALQAEGRLTSRRS